MTDAGHAREQPAEIPAPPQMEDAAPNTPVNPTGPPRRAAIPAKPLSAALGFAVVAALMSLQPLAGTTLLKLFYEKSEQLIQAPLPEGIPVPQSLIWPPRLSGLLVSLGSLTSAAVLGLLILFSLCLIYGLFRVLNPTFRVTTGVDWDRHLLVKTYMHGEPLTKAFLIAIAAAIPAGILWAFLGWALGDNSFSLWLRLALAGATVWFLFSQEGVAGDFESGNYDPPLDRRIRRSLLLRGALAGSIGWLMLRFGPALSTDDLFTAYRAMGFIGPGEWGRIAFVVLGFAGAYGFTGGWFAAALGTPGWSAKRRISAAALPAVALLATTFMGRIGVPSYFASTYDYVPNSSVKAESRLAGLCRLEAKHVARTAHLLDTGHAYPIHFSGASVTGLSAVPANARAIEKYLTSHSNRSALSYPAYTTIHDAALLNWSVDEALGVYLRNLSGAPDMSYVTHLLNKLQYSAFSPTPGVVAALDRLANDRLFDYSDRRAWVLTGDLYARFGIRNRAEACYRRAEMPASQVTLRADERTLNPDGRFIGRLLLNGKPVIGAKIGLVSQRSLDELGRMTDYDTHNTSPFWLFWLGASTTTDQQGRFTIDKLLYGQYELLLELPSLPAGTNITAPDAPGITIIRAGAPPVDLGDIHLFAAPATTPARPSQPSSPPRSGRSPAA